MRPHPLEEECDRIITELGGSLAAMKQTHDTGCLYNGGTAFGVSLYMALPLYLPTMSQNLFRLEFTIGEVDQKEVGRILFAITTDLDQRYFPLRVVPRTRNDQNYQIVLQCISDTNLVQAGFISSIVITALELAEFYRTEFLQDQKKVA